MHLQCSSAAVLFTLAFRKGNARKAANKNNELIRSDRKHFNADHQTALPPPHLFNMDVTRRPTHIYLMLAGFSSPTRVPEFVLLR